MIPRFIHRKKSIGVMSILLDPGSPTKHGQSKAGFHGVHTSGVRVRTHLASLPSGALSEVQIIPRGLDIKRHTMCLKTNKVEVRQFQLSSNVGLGFELLIDHVYMQVVVKHSQKLSATYSKLQSLLRRRETCSRDSDVLIF